MSRQSSGSHSVRVGSTHGRLVIVPSTRDCREPLWAPASSFDRLVLVTALLALLMLEIPAHKGVFVCAIAWSLCGNPHLIPAIDRQGQRHHAVIVQTIRCRIANAVRRVFVSEGVELSDDDAKRDLQKPLLNDDGEPLHELLLGLRRELEGLKRRPSTLNILDHRISDRSEEHTAEL